MVSPETASRKGLTFLQSHVKRDGKFIWQVLEIVRQQEAVAKIFGILLQAVITWGFTAHMRVGAHSSVLPGTYL